MKYLFVLVVPLLWVCDCGSGEKISLNFSYITTKTGSFVSSGGIPAVDLALEQINNRTDILPNYTLNYTTILDSEVRIEQQTACLLFIIETAVSFTYACSVMAQHLWMLSWRTSEMFHNPPMCLFSAVGAPLPPSLLLKSAITGISPRLE